MTRPNQTSFGDTTSFISTLIRVDNWSLRLPNEYKSPCKVKTFLLKTSAAPGGFEHRFALLQQVELYSLFTSLEAPVFIITKTPHQHPGVPGLYLAGFPLGIETEVSGSLWGLRTEYLPSPSRFSQTARWVFLICVWNLLCEHLLHPEHSAETLAEKSEGNGKCLKTEQ